MPAFNASPSGRYLVAGDRNSAIALLWDVVLDLCTRMFITARRTDTGVAVLDAQFHITRAKARLWIDPISLIYGRTPCSFCLAGRTPPLCVALEVILVVGVVHKDVVNKKVPIRA